MIIIIHPAGLQTNPSKGLLQMNFLVFQKLKYLSNVLLEPDFGQVVDGLLIAHGSQPLELPPGSIPLLQIVSQIPKLILFVPGLRMDHQTWRPPIVAIVLYLIPPYPFP